MTFKRLSAAGPALAAALLVAVGAGTAEAGPIPAAAASSPAGLMALGEADLVQRVQGPPRGDNARNAPRAPSGGRDRAAPPPRAYAPPARGNGPSPRAYAPPPRAFAPPPRAYAPPRGGYYPRAYGAPRGGYYGPRTWAYRPWYRRPYYGTIIGGIALGTIIGVTAYGLAPLPPRDDLCWYWADEMQSSGYWDYC